MNWIKNIVLVLLLVSGSAVADISIAIVGPMTGARAWSGEQFRRGADLAVSDINASGGVLGHRLKLTVADDAADIEQARAVANKLVANNIPFVVGHRSSDTSIAASSIYARHRVIQISPSSTNPLLTEQGLKNVFRVCGRDDQQSELAVSYLKDSIAGDKIAIVHDKSIYGHGLAEKMSESLKRLGKAPIVQREISAGQLDFTSLLDHLKQSGVNQLFFGGYSTEAGLIVKQAVAMNYKLDFIGSDSLHNSDFWMIAGQAGQNVRFTFGRDHRNNPAAQKAVATFRKNQYEPEGYTLHTYAAIQVWAMAVNKAQSLDYDSVLHQLHSERFDTVIGTIQFDENGDLLEHQFQWYQWIDGQYLPVE